jgi:acetyl-CoA carboxylase carboxyl transferase subunit beta
MRIVIGVADFAFMGGSMGSVYGEKIARAMERGLELAVPIVIFSASGGARMQEGLLALMQMAKTAAAVRRVADSRLPYVSVLTNPTTGGVFASYASLADVTLAEPGAIVGFAGRRVGRQDLGAHLPANFQTSEFQHEHGIVDRLVARKEMRPTLSFLLRFYMEGRSDGR